MKKRISFTKMTGAGNDFVIIEATKGLTLKKIGQNICHRTDGIGADGLLVLDKSKKADYRMRIINADGSEAEMCGNGVRCLAAYIVKNKKPKKKFFTIETIAGIILAQAKGEVANVRLSPPKGYKPRIPLNINKQKINVDYIDTGVPHVVVFVDGLPKINVKDIGRVIRFHKKFSPRGTNVNFVEQLKSNFVQVRTYERGVEDETRACGTGSVAVGIIASLKSNPDLKNTGNSSVKVKTASGEILNIRFSIENKKIKDVWLNGSAKFIAKGEYYV